MEKKCCLECSGTLTHSVTWSCSLGSDGDSIQVEEVEVEEAVAVIYNNNICIKQKPRHKLV